MKKYSLILLSLIASIICRATGNNTNYIPIMTPEAASLGQYGSFPVSLYSGSVDISIPIHTMKTNGITIPISLQYTGTGLIPNKDCGKVGHDWSLIAGGAITRTVNGVPDEWLRNGEMADADTDFELGGLLAYIRSSNPELSNEDFYQHGHLDLIADGWESTPDMFSFNFCGHSGQFMIGHDGSVKVVGDGTYKVDISNLQLQTFASPTQISSITITDGYGTKYTFGGNIYSLEINLKKTPASTTHIPNGVIGAFYLTRIETADGEYVIFQYTDKEDDQNNTYANFSQSENGHSDGINIVRTPHYSDFHCEFTNENISSLVLNPTYDLGVSYTKTVYLHKIITSFGEDAVFNYTLKEIPFSNVKEQDFWDKGTSYNQRLNDIRITNSCGDVTAYATLHHSYPLSYDYKSGKYPSELQKMARMFLDSVFVNKERYSFEYTTKEKLPLPYTRGIDRQGYYNGNDYNSNLLGITSTGQSPTFTNRQPDFNKSSMGMLSRITYPTGGTTEFVFENHYYSKAVVFSTGGDNIVNLTPVTRYGYSGGLRIKEIRNTPGETISYQYINSDGSSSGVFNDTRRYSTDFNFAGNIWRPTRLLMYSASNIVAGNTVSEPETGYARIVERRGNGNGYTVYTYTTYADFMDEPVLEGNDNKVIYNNTTIDDICSTIHLTSLHLERGKLISKEDYSNNNKLLRKTSYTYNSIDMHRNDAIFSGGYRLLLGNKFMGNIVAHYHYPKHIISTTTHDYSGDIATSKTVEYTYNAHNQLVCEEKTVDSDGSIFAKKIYYPRDFPGNKLLESMTDSNVVMPVVKEEQYSNNKLEHTVEYEFSKYHDKYYDVSAIKETYGNNAPFYPLVVHSRNKHRNIESMTQFGKPATHYLWSYGYQYPVAMIGNITTSKFNEKLPQEKREEIAGNFAIHSTGKNIDSTHRQLLNTLNSADYFPGAHITLYKFRPQVGMTYCQTPDKVETFYSYHNFGRLSQIAKGSQQEVVQTFSYNSLYTNKFDAYWVGSFAQNKVGQYTFRCGTICGSGSHTYKLQIKKGDNIVGTSQNSTISYNFNAAGTYTFCGTVYDDVTGETASFSYTFAIFNPSYVGFSDIDANLKVDHGSYNSSAIINCTAPATVTFSILCEVEGLPYGATYGCRIGDSFFLTEEDEWPEKSFTVELEAGENCVEIYMEGFISASGNINIIIESVEGNNQEAGGNLSLSLSTDKAN